MVTVKIGRREWLKGVAAFLIPVGCSTGTNRQEISRLEEEIVEDLSWSNYVRTLYQLCEKQGRSFVGKEKLFYRYLDWLSEISGTPINHGNFSIWPGGNSLGWAVSFEDHMDLSDRTIDLNQVSHEFGHLTDKHLNPIRYMLSREHRVRVEAVAEAFAHYTGLRLMQEGNSLESKDHLLHRRVEMIFEKEGVSRSYDPIEIMHVMFYGYKGLDDIIKNQRAPIAGTSIVMILIAEFREMEKTWRFLAEHREDEVYSKCNKIIEKEGSLVKALQEGYKSTVDESNELIQKNQEGIR